MPGKAQNLPTAEEIVCLMERLTGQKAPFAEHIDARIKTLLDARGHALGYSQFNELLLLLGYSRVTHSFFQYLINGKLDYQSGTAFKSAASLEKGIDRFRQLGIFCFGNVKYAFKTLSSERDDLARALTLLTTRTVGSFKDRHKPVYPIDDIPGEKAYYLGHIVEKELEKRLQENPADSAAKKEEKTRKNIVKTGTQNFKGYLVSDHLDVYVATSMRERHEYIHVHDFVRRIFSHSALKPLQLRYFDPTQAYCPDRIDKGLAEGLMLKRARCTIYFAQESDTLGKDSELASTLAQGKPVVAYVPNVSRGSAAALIEQLQRAYPRKATHELIIEQLRIFSPKGAWENQEIRRWLDSPSSMNIKKAMLLLQTAVGDHYNQRAKNLKETHPLGIQVNLGTGVANGVLVVRSVKQCAELVRRIVMNTLEFEIEDKKVNGLNCVYLIEKISGCVFRVVTGDQFLTNTFWNFYLLPVE